MFRMPQSSAPPSRIPALLDLLLANARLLVLPLLCAGCSSDFDAAPREVSTVAQAIVFGAEVPEGKYPWMAKVPGCTGALISPHFVLTAAHCYGGRRNDEDTLEGVEISSGVIRFGQPDLQDPKTQQRVVKQVHLHPEYILLTSEEAFGKEPFDSALLELEQPVYLEKYLNLPTRQAVEGEVIVAAGWGITEAGGGPSQVLRETTLKVRSRSTCFDGDQKRFCSTGSDDNPESNIASGDSGGPVFVVEDDGHMLLGTNSTSNGPAANTRGMHAAVVEFVPWITEVAGRDIRDACALGFATCDLQAACLDTLDGFECECNVGYVGDGTVCSDVDECAESTDSCRVDQVCANTEGSFECGCPEGHVDFNDGAGCQAVCGDNHLAPSEQCDFPSGSFQAGCVAPGSTELGAQPCTVVAGYSCTRTGDKTDCVVVVESVPTTAPSAAPSASAPVSVCAAEPCGQALPVAVPQTPQPISNTGGCQLAVVAKPATGVQTLLYTLVLLCFWRRSRDRAHQQVGASLDA